MTHAKTVTDTTDEAQAVIVLGFDEKSKPRAARFAAPQAALATKAANLMGLVVCPITPELADLSKKAARRSHLRERGRLRAQHSKKPVR